MIVVLLVLAALGSEPGDYRVAYGDLLEAHKLTLGELEHVEAEKTRLEGEVELLKKRVDELEHRDLVGRPAPVLAPEHLECEAPPALLHLGAALGLCGLCAAGGAGAAVLLQDQP